tara:strand:- start:3682 stop:4443 length:762 start_codon:yes stop_codon:yes gene_type:complete
MKIIIITQNEPFFLKENLTNLFSLLPRKCKIVGCIVSDVSPFGKKESFIQKSIKTYKIFGLNFFLYYSLKYIHSKIFKGSIKNLLKKNNIKEIKLKGSINNSANLKLISSYNPDLLVSILGNQIFKKDLINLASKGCINLHTALLPKYRGLMPTFWVLKNNEKYTGVSVFFVDEGIDSGPIILQKKIKIDNKTQSELIQITKNIGMELVANAITLILNDQVELIQNPDSESTYFSFPNKNDVKVFLKAGKKFF